MQDYSSIPYIPNTPPCMTPRNQYMMPQAVPGMMQMPQAPMGMAGLEQYTYPQNLPEALKLIRESVAAETEDRLFYQYLIENAPSDEDKEIITGIRDDEIRHFGLFRRVYFQLTGQILPPPQNVTFEAPASYCEGIKKAIRGEQNAVRRYSRIFFAMQDRVLMNVITGIITDEIRHGSLYNYLYAKNGCRV